MRIGFIYGAMCLGTRYFDFENIWTSKRGTTGSEISFLVYAKELVKRGHDVSLYVDKPNADSYDGVKVRPRDKWVEESGQFDVGYSWNEPDEFRGVPEKVLRVVNQQLNDFVYCKPGYDDIVDVWTSPSQSHKDNVAKILAPRLDKWVVVYNGCYPEAYDLTKKVRGRVVYTSSPDRGLHLLVSAWPTIKKAAPHAHLRIFYYALEGWIARSEEFERFAGTHKEPGLMEQARRAQYIKHVLKHKDRLGIEVVGSVSREEMVSELSAAQILGYPYQSPGGGAKHPVTGKDLGYCEGFSCAILEGCAAGAVPVITDADALGELYGAGATPMVAAPAHKNLDAWTNLMIRGLNDDAWREDYMVKCHTRSKKFAWPALTEQLEKMLLEKLAAKHGTARIADVSAPMALSEIAQAVGVAKALDSAKAEVKKLDPAKPLEFLAFASKPANDSKRKPVIHMTLTPAMTGGRNLEVLNPEKDDQGGGSRAGFLGLVTALPKLGYKVRAFCPVPETVEKDGVEYIPLGQLRAFGTPDVFLAYYDTGVLSDITGCLRIASHHSFRPYPNEHFIWTDVNVAPSQYACDELQRNWDPWGTWRVLPNGSVDLGVKHQPIPGRVVYHTSPSRGLELLVEVWPEIKRRVPFATLHLGGDINGWMTGYNAQDKLSSSELGKRARRLREALPLAEKAGGLKLLGHLSRGALNQELSEASCFAFPFSPLAPCETFSISVLECCRLGVPVVLSPADALESIYSGHVKMVPGPANGHMAEFADAVVDVLSSETSARYWSEQGKKLAAKYTFENAAKALDAICQEHGINRSPVMTVVNGFAGMKDQQILSTI